MSTDDPLVARARELASLAGLPLRNRWGYDAPDRDVRAVLDLLREQPDDALAALAVGIGNALGDIQLCSGHDMPLDEQEELSLVQALRPLTNQTPVHTEN